MLDLVSMIKVSVLWRGNRYVAEVNSGSSLKELGQELQKLTDVKEDTMRFIVPQNKGSKLLSPFSDEHSSLSLQEGFIVEGKPIRMMGASEDEVGKLRQSEKTDLRIVGFDEEEKRIRQRLLHAHKAPLKLPQGQYIFYGFRTLQIPGIELNPPASEALKRLHMLAADPGIVAIMNKHRWRVGIMTELAPVGYVGISPKCILGFNKNHGEEISLRLRTDDLKGFRKYESIKKTLLHELAHMVYSEHDANFYALDSQLNQEAVALDWTKSRGHTLTGVRLTSHYEDDLFAGDGGNFSRKLGGNISHKLASASASSVAAAYRRLDNASASSLGASEEREEPDLTGSDLVMHEETYHRGSAAKENVDAESPSRYQWEGHEPDPDDHCGYRNKLEPDPDDSRDKEASKPEKCTDPEIVQQVSSNKLAAMSSYKEPDPDGLESSWKSGVVEVPESLCSQLMEVDCTVLSRKTSAEPDPDESEDKLKIKIADDTMDIDGNLLNAKREPDPDESLENEVTSEEPDPDDNLVCPQGISSMKTDEPDPDDQELRRIQDSVTVVCSRLQKAIEMLRAEVSTMEVTAVLQTLFKIIRNVIEHPDETKYKRLRKANPVIQRSVVNYKAAMEILYLVGFIEDVVSDEIGKAETYLVLKRNDPGLLWLAKSSLETCIAH